MIMDVDDIRIEFEYEPFHGGDSVCPPYGDNIEIVTVYIKGIDITEIVDDKIIERRIRKWLSDL